MISADHQHEEYPDVCVACAIDTVRAGLLKGMIAPEQLGFTNSRAWYRERHDGTVKDTYGDYGHDTAMVHPETTPNVHWLWAAPREPA